MLFRNRSFASALHSLILVAAQSVLLGAHVFVLPTPNRAIFTPGAEADYFVPTPGRTWTSGTFGCVRSEGFQMHEGLDIKHTKRDIRGEPLDPIYAAAEGREQRRRAQGDQPWHWNAGIIAPTLPPRGGCDK